MKEQKPGLVLRGIFWMAAMVIGMALASECSRASALADPDLMEIEAVFQYDSILEGGDRLYIVQYEIDYTSIPDETVTEGFLGRLVDDSGQLGSTQLYAGGAIPDLGYTRGLYSFYFEEAPTISGALEVILQGNIALSPTPRPVSTTSIVNRSGVTLLAIDIIQAAVTYETHWTTQEGEAIDLIDVQNASAVLTPDGDEYFSNTIPLLQSMLPGIFSVAQTGRTNTPETFTEVYEESLDDMWVGTPVENASVNLAASLGLNVTIFETMIALIIAAFVGFLALSFTGGQTGMAAMAGYTVLLGFALVGWGGLAFVGLVAFASLIMLGWVLFYRGSAA